MCLFAFSSAENPVLLKLAAGTIEQYPVSWKWQDVPPHSAWNKDVIKWCTAILVGILQKHFDEILYFFG